MAVVTNAGPTRIKSIGSFTEIFAGRVDASGTTSTITLPAGLIVVAAVATYESGNEDDNVAVTAYSNNTFTVTTKSGVGFSWIAFATGGL